MARTKTITGVELVSVGTWAASTGVTKVTEADLRSMLAAHDDGLVDRGPVKLGHSSPLNDDLGDGAPAYGWVEPTHIAANSAGLLTLYGNLVAMPAQLAEVAPTAYRRRSVEIAWNVTTAGGKKYPAVLIGIALLGATPPAVKGLADLVALYGEQPASIGTTAAVHIVTGLEDNPVAVAMLAAAAQAGASPAQLDSIAAAAGASDTASIPPPTRDGDHHETHSTAPQTQPQERPEPMTDDELREAPNIEASANIDDELRRILDERTAQDPAPAAGEAATEQPAPTSDPAPAEPAPVADPAPAEPSENPVAPVGEPELVQLSAANYAELTALAEQTRQQRRDGALDDAIRAGRIAPAERSAFAAQMARDEEGTISLLGSLAPRFAVSELGSAAAPNSQAADEAFDQFEAETFGLTR